MKFMMVLISSYIIIEREVFEYDLAHPYVVVKRETCPIFSPLRYDDAQVRSYASSSHIPYPIE